MPLTGIPSASPAAQASAVFYRFEDGQGRVHIVDSWHEVPESQRGNAQRVELGPRPAPAASSRTVSPAGPPSSPRDVDWGSFGAGFAAATLLGAALLLLRRSSPLTKVFVSVGCAALLGAAYLGWLRRETGQSDAAVATPAELVDDTRRAVEKLENRRKEQERLLEEIRREASGR